jgi:hypothetical protein
MLRGHLGAGIQLAPAVISSLTFSSFRRLSTAELVKPESSSFQNYQRELDPGFRRDDEQYGTTIPKG